MLRNIVRLVVLGLVVHAAVRITPEFWHYLKFKDAVTEVATFSQRKTPEQIPRTRRQARARARRADHEPRT